MNEEGRWLEVDVGGEEVGDKVMVVGEGGVDGRGVGEEEEEVMVCGVGRGEKRDCMVGEVKDVDVG